MGKRNARIDQPEKEVQEEGGSQGGHFLEGRKKVKE
jgi:hypothetical protein